MRTNQWILGGAMVGMLWSGCAARVDEKGVQVETGGRSRALASGAEAAATGAQHCDASDARHEESSYDTSGDDVPDVRKVFLRVGDEKMERLVLVCRESDLNSDGVKDIVRFYSDEGEPVREEADRNFDGQMDEITYFQQARIIRQEFDTTGNGKVDLKLFFKNGEAIRSERDVAARSTATDWRPDRWEYFEEGRMVRMGTDLDGDGKVDRWDRDDTLSVERGGLRSEEDVIEEEPEEGDDSEG